MLVRASSGGGGSSSELEIEKFTANKAADSSSLTINLTNGKTPKLFYMAIGGSSNLITNVAQSTGVLSNNYAYRWANNTAISLTLSEKKIQLGAFNVSSSPQTFTGIAVY